MKKTNYDIYCDFCKKMKHEDDKWIMLNYKEFSTDYKEPYIGSQYNTLVMLPEYNRLDFCCFPHFIDYFKRVYDKDMKNIKKRED